MPVEVSVFRLRNGVRPAAPAVYRWIGPLYSIEAELRLNGGTI